MKKTFKFLALFLAVIVMMSSFGIMASAISSSSSMKEILNFYESQIISLSAKESVIKAVNEYTLSSEPDVSGLTSADANATKELYSYEETGEAPIYFFGDSNREEHVDGRSQFIDFFSIKRDIKRYDLVSKNAKYSKDKNGVSTVTLVYLEQFDDGETVCTYTAKFDKNGYILYYRLKQVSEYEAESVRGKNITISEIVDDIYTFNYKQTGVKSMALSEDSVELKAGEEVVITAIVKPENATFKGVYAETDDFEIADCYVEDDGEIHIIGEKSGKTTIRVYTYDGDISAECEVVVKSASFFDKIIEFFRSLFAFFFGF